MKIILFAGLSLFLAAGALADNDLKGFRIVDTGPTQLSGLTHWSWQNCSNDWLNVKRIQMFTTNGFGASWIIRRLRNDVVMITTNPDGAIADFGNDYMQVAPGEYLDVYFQADSGTVFIWEYPVPVQHP